ncbi:hypothetical protein [Duganella phyllosphaerae]|uniref:Uncharacterized protein n=1 Tax=Duganella phyllosphaerae TaxID=762836 RepID=A0A1E7X7G4_9BURK|nr:hypothetical protein [Duganella phyllosphaerae]OFA09010.1 hypothetical protein DUPY_02520 [Duganella phyllosphaerae]
MQSQGIELAYLAGVDAQGPGDGHLVQSGCFGTARNDADVFTELLPIAVAIRSPAAQGFILNYPRMDTFIRFWIKEDNSKIPENMEANA